MDAALHSSGTQLVYTVHKTLSFVQKWLGLACGTRMDITIKGLKFVCWVGQDLMCAYLMLHEIMTLDQLSTGSNQILDVCNGGYVQGVHGSIC